MVEDPELRAVVRQFILEDARQRVDRMVVGIRESIAEAKYHVTPRRKFGVVDSVDELPDPSPSHAKRQWTPLHVEWEGKVEWFDIPLHGDSEWSGFSKVYCTYRKTPYLLHQLWVELSKDPDGPQVPAGYSLEPIGNKQSTHERLTGAGVECQLAYFKPVTESVGLARQYSLAFIQSIRLPGRELVKFDTLDAQIRFLNAITLESGPDPKRQVGRGNSEDLQFLRKLKARCYATKEENGPFAAKFAFDTYKEVAKYLNGHQNDHEKTA